MRDNKTGESVVFMTSIVCAERGMYPGEAAYGSTLDCCVLVIDHPTIFIDSKSIGVGYLDMDARIMSVEVDEIKTNVEKERKVSSQMTIK
ncbi:hypothetical protein Tco_1518394, partial [Tanacetum coccineum]